MDFPISVPSIGLVDGKFADEDPLAGTPGSLIPAQWGNGVTLEILNVIEAAGLVPDEEDNTQLLAAITANVTPAATEVVAGKAMLASLIDAEAGVDNSKIMTPLRVFQAIAKKVVQATESVFGWVKIATQAQVDAGADDATAVTPKKLRWGFASSLTSNGYITFPSWLGGFIIQWGSAITTSGVVVPNFTLAFPNSCFWAGMCISSAAFLGQLTPSIGNTTLTTIQLLVSTGASVGAGSVGVRWLALGR